MVEDWEFLFDLCGYIHIPNALTPEEVEAANRAVDNHLHELSPKDQTAGPRREDLRHMLGWEGTDRAPFANMLAHRKLVPYLNVICGRGFRMDHAPTLITQQQGAPAGNLHGSSGPGFDTNQYYLWKNGQMHNGLVVVAFQLVDHAAGAGGLAVVPGSVRVA